MRMISTWFLFRARNISALAVGVLTFLGSFDGQSTAVAQSSTLVVTQMWSIASGSQSYVTITNTERGIAYNPVTDHALIVSRNLTTPSSNAIVVLNSETGAELGQLDLTGISGGTFIMSTIGVTEDGVIYVANLVTGGRVLKFIVGKMKVSLRPWLLTGRRIPWWGGWANLSM